MVWDSRPSISCELEPSLQDLHTKLYVADHREVTEGFLPYGKGITLLSSSSMLSDLTINSENIYKVTVANIVTKQCVFQSFDN